MPFVKLDSGILTSTIWYLRPDLEVFLAALLMAEPRELVAPVPTIKTDSLEKDDFVVPPGWYGFVSAAGPGLVHRAHVDEQAGMDALKRLAAPERESRSQAFDGRRMVRVDGGYIVLNFDQYRQKDHTTAERSRRYRERKHASRVSTVTQRVTTRGVTQAEAEAEAEKTKTVARASAPLPDGEWISSLETNPAYQGVPVAVEIAKCRVWCATNRKGCSRRRIVSWLNRYERPVGYNGQHQFAGGFQPNVAVLVEPEPKGWREQFPEFVDRLSPWAKINPESRAHICKEMARLEESSFG